MGAIRSSSGAPEAVHLRRVRTHGDRPSDHQWLMLPDGEYLDDAEPKAGS